MANPPSKPWKCPCHVDDLLDKLPSMLGPAHKYRKVKGAMKPAATRTARNNGRIEIEDSDGEEEAIDSGFYQHIAFGKEYRLPQRAVKLDFIRK